VINVDTENATAWAIRSEVLIAMGKADEAKDELASIRRTWGRDNPTIDEGYRRVDFELRVQRADDELFNLVAQLQAGTLERVFTKGDEGRNSEPKQPVRKVSANGERSRRTAPHRKLSTDDGERVSTSRNLHVGVERRSSSKSRNGRRTSRVQKRHNSSGSDLLSAAVPSVAPSSPKRKNSFVPPPSVDDMRNETDPLTARTPRDPFLKHGPRVGRR
jgi:hypothetical protein